MQQKMFFATVCLLTIVLLLLSSCKGFLTGNTVHEEADRDYNYCLFKCETEFTPGYNPQDCKQVCLGQLEERMKEKAETLK